MSTIALGHRGVGAALRTRARALAHSLRQGRAGRLAEGVARELVAAIMPPVCCLCGARGQAPDLDLCDICTTFLPVPGRAAHGAGPLPVPGAPGSWPAMSDGTLVRTLFLFKYEYPVDHFIRALKFRGERVFARVLGDLMAREHRARGWEQPVCIVPMPLHAARYRERGFNQAEQIARYAAASLRVRVDSRSLVRTLATRKQSGLTLDERRCNVRGAFEVVRPLPAGRIALLDDVVTTGSTAMAAARALLDAGALDIELWAVARVERRDNEVVAGDDPRGDLEARQLASERPLIQVSSTMSFSSASTRLAR